MYRLWEGEIELLCGEAGSEYTNDVMDRSKLRVFCGIECDLHWISRSVMGAEARERGINCENGLFCFAIRTHTQMQIQTHAIQRVCSNLRR